MDLDVDLLDLDCDNPRHDRMTDQADALAALIDDQGRKLVNLALDIHSHGLNPAQRFVVIEQPDDEGRFTVLDGNRRLAAVRILKQPDLLPASVSTDQFEQQAHTEGHRPDRVACCVMPDRESASIWLERIHTGEFDGLGTVGWTPAAQTRFRTPTRRTQTSSAIAVLDWLSDRTADDDALLAPIGIVKLGKTTNLGRLLTDGTVRVLIGLNFDKHAIVPLAPDTDLIRRLSAIVADLAGTTTVAALIHKQDRLNYIGRILGDDTHPGGDSTQTDTAASDPSSDSDDGTSPEDPDTSDDDEEPSNSSEDEEPEEASAKRRSTRRRTPRLFEDLRPTGLKSRTRNIFEELQRLNLDDFPNAAAVLLRTAVELSVVQYLEANNVDLKAHRTLADRIRAVIARIQVADKAKRYHGITTDLAQPDSLGSATNMNSYVHNPNNPPRPQELVAISVRYGVLIQDISDDI